MLYTKDSSTFEDVVRDPASAVVPEDAGAAAVVAWRLAHRVNADTLDPVMDYAERLKSQALGAYVTLILMIATDATKIPWASTNAKFTAAAADIGRYF